MILDMLASPLMQRSLLAALLVGLCAPIVGTYLVHRRLAMLGDGIGHISLTGVALGWLAGTAAMGNPRRVGRIFAWRDHYRARPPVRAYFI